MEGHSVSNDALDSSLIGFEELISDLGDTDDTENNSEDEQGVGCDLTRTEVEAMGAIERGGGAFLEAKG